MKRQVISGPKVMRLDLKEWRSVGPFPERPCSGSDTLWAWPMLFGWAFLRTWSVRKQLVCQDDERDEGNGAGFSWEAGLSPWLHKGKKAGGPEKVPYA